MLTWEIIFWISVLAIFHSYLLYPLWLAWLAKTAKQNSIIFNEKEQLPPVAILIAAFNEEKVIARKIQSIYQTHYPKDKLTVIIGSDGSTDNTVAIIEQEQKKYPNLSVKQFTGRNGKPNILNELLKMVSQRILIFTDANVLFEPGTIYELVKHFKNEKISLVGANVINMETKQEGISVQEKAYIQRENTIKYYEGIIWGSMMGAFGACYAVRRADMVAFPPNFLMEDFFITMNVLKKGKKAITELHAVCVEDVSVKLKEEFKRKVRISAGNFQNLSRYYTFLLKPFSPVGFCFLSHKVLRWFGPFFIIMAYLCNAILSGNSEFYWWVFILQNTLLAVAAADLLLKKINIDWVPLRFLSYFYTMNVALLVGFFKFLSGIKTSAWQPTERNQ